jgi:hypothetical protein
MGDDEKSAAKHKQEKAETALTPEAKRALAEAEARRRAKTPKPQAKEIDGPRGPEPTRFGDWEKKGIASDF